MKIKVDISINEIFKNKKPIINFPLRKSVNVDLPKTNIEFKENIVP